MNEPESELKPWILTAAAGALFLVLSGGAWWMWWMIAHPSRSPAETWDVEPSPELPLPNNQPNDEGSSRRSRPSPREASCELAILTDRTASAVLPGFTPVALVDRLNTTVCGRHCPHVVEVVKDESSFAVELTTADDYMMPTDEAFDAMTVSLTKADRASIGRRSTVAVIRVHRVASAEQLVARTCFAAAAVWAGAWGGLIYDEATRRIESYAQFRDRVIAALDEPTLRTLPIALQVTRSDDGSARVNTLGMQRFGKPDLLLRAPSLLAADALGDLVNLLASKELTAGEEGPLTATPQELALLARKPAKIAPSNSELVRFERVESERLDGDSDNELVELVPGNMQHGATGALGGGLLGPLVETPATTSTDGGARAALEHVRPGFPDALRRAERGEVRLVVKGVLARDTEEVQDSVATAMAWVEVRSCTAATCTGMLSHAPGSARNFVAGGTAQLQRRDIVDWAIASPDEARTAPRR